MLEGNGNSFEEVGCQVVSNKKCPEQSDRAVGWTEIVSRIVSNNANSTCIVRPTLYIVQKHMNSVGKQSPFHGDKDIERTSQILGDVKGL